MLAKIAQRITAYFIKIKAIEGSDKEVYDYCFEIMLATICNGLALVLVAIFTKTYIETLLFVIVFFVLRSSAGGYHAKTHFGCFLTLMIFYGAFIVAIMTASMLAITWMYIVFSIFSTTIIFLFAPVESPNNPISATKKEKMAIRSIVITVFVNIISILVITVFSFPILAFSLLAGETVVAVSLLLAKML